MEYDDSNFINRDSQVVDKDKYQSNAEEGQVCRPSFDLVEPLGVQLGFDSLDEASVLLHHQSQREENWTAHFSREENGVLGLEAGSQNIEFSSTATQSSTISRHVNVWSEATSSESVQMLLNSVGQDEENLVEGPDTCESLQTPENDKEYNMSISESSPCNIEAVLDIECKTASEKNQQGFENPAMDVKDDKQQLPLLSVSPPDNSLELKPVSDLDSRPTDKRHFPTEEDASEKIEGERENSAPYGASVQDLSARSPVPIVSHRDTESHGLESQLNDNQLSGFIASPESGSLKETKIESSALQGVPLPDVSARSSVIDNQRDVESHGLQTQLNEDHLADFVPSDETGSLTEMEDTRQGGMNENPRDMVLSDNDAGQNTTVTASFQETHVDSGQSKQPISVPILGEINEDHAGRCVTEATQEDAFLSEMQGPSTSSLDENCNEDTGNYAAGKDVVIANLQGCPGPLVDERIEISSFEDSSQPSQKSKESIEAQGISESLLDKSTEITEVLQAETTVVLQAEVPPGDFQGMPEFILAKIKVEKTEQCVVNTSMDVDIQGMPEVVSDKISDEKTQEHVADTSMKVDIQGMAEIASDEVSDKKTEQLATDTSMDVDIQGMPEFVSDKISDEKTQEHVVDSKMKVDIQGMAEIASDEVSDKKTEQLATDTLMEVDVQGVPEFVSDKINNEKTEQQATDTSIELDVQQMPGFVSDKINDENAKEHVADTSMEVEVPDKIQDMPDPLQSTKNSKVGDLVDIETVNQKTIGELEQISDLMRAEIVQCNAEKHAENVSCKDIMLVEKKGIPDSSLEEGDEHGGGKHFIEASLDSLSQTCDDEQARNGGVESMQGSAKDLQETSVFLQEKIHEQKENGPKTEEKCSAENLIRTCSEGLTTVDAESDSQVKDSEGVMTTLGLDSSPIAASNASSSHIDHTSPNIKLTVEKGSTPVMQNKNAENQVSESVSPICFQDDQIQDAFLVNHAEKLVHGVTGSPGENGPEKCLEAISDVTQNESVDVQAIGSQVSLDLEKPSSVEGHEDQENEGKDASIISVLPTKDIKNLVKATSSPEGKDILIPSHTVDENDGCNFGATSLQGRTQSPLPADQPMTDTLQQVLQVNYPCITSESDSKHTNQMNLEFERNCKEDDTFVCIKVQNEEKTDTMFSSDGPQPMPIPDLGHSANQTMVEVSQSDIPEENVNWEAQKLGQEKETEEVGKDKGKAEAMEVSLEVGISLEPDNKSPATDKGDNHLQSCLLLPNVDGPSVENSGLVPMKIESGKLSSVSNEGDDKVEKVGTESGDLEAKTISQINDTFTFEIGTKNVPTGEGIYGSVDFTVTQSGEIDKNVGCWKPFPTSQPSEVIQNKASAACQTGKDEAEACQKHANENVNSAVPETISILQEGGSVFADAKAKPVPSGEKRSHAKTVTESDKKFTSHDKKSGDSQVVSLCTTATICSPSIRPGSHSSKIGVRQEQKSSRTDLPDIGPQFTASCTMQLSALPDLNATVVPASVLFQQPFTDSQQVQLRAQILVYGSLIQGSLPDEALMLTAFSDIGGASQSGSSASDGGRSMWENAWHIASDRIHGKGFSNSSDIPVHTPSSSTTATVSSKMVEVTKITTPSASVNATDSRNPASGMRSADLVVPRSHLLPSRMTGASNVGRVGSKNTPRAIMSPPRPLSLSPPVWSTPVNEGVQGSTLQRSLHLEPHQMTAARHLYQSAQLGHYPTPGSAAPWMPHLPFPGPWVAPPQGPPPESGLQISSFAVPEGTQDAHNNRRNSVSPSVPYTPMTPVVPHFPSMVGATTVPTGTNVGTDVPKTGVALGRQSSKEQKPRKRKKKSVSEEIVQTGGLQVTSTVPKHPAEPTSVPSLGPSMIVSTTSNALIAQGTGIPGTPSVSHYQVISRGETGQRIIFSEETATRIEQAKLNAEDAASIAATAVRHSQGIWSQLAAQRNSGLISECEAKLASAAVAAAAAASVAKAAAAAAKIASDAALQAKHMAMEALSSDGKQDAIFSSEIGLLEGSQGHSHSIIATAREAAKKRVEAASAATKRAENLDAVVRAAELAAQAVSQAGAVVAMGDPVPLPLNVLLEAGPEAYWKLMNQEAIIQKDDNVHSETPTQQIVIKNDNIVQPYKSKDKKDAFKNETSRNTKGGMKGPATELSKQAEKDVTQMPDRSQYDTSTEKDVEARKENQVLRTSQLAAPVSVTETVARGEIVALETEPSSKNHREPFASKANDIKEASLVEVVSDEEGLRGVWFSAKVLSLKDGKAFVRYDELLSDEGPGQLQEWIPLEGDNGKAPRIRMAHPMTVIKFEGTRKRRRAAMGNYIWSVGDHVDAWIRDGWWEGIVTGIKDNDESKLIVHFPGEGDTSIIKAWNLRPSLIWKDGQWVEWTSLKAEKNVVHEGELPPEKRQKLDNHETGGDAKGKEKLQKVPNVEEAKKMQTIPAIEEAKRMQKIPNIEEARKTQELNAVMSFSKDKFLTAGKSLTDDGSSAGIKVNQIGLQTEGSKVVFGIPRQAKKRKFMDVSKHYVADTMTRSISDGKSSGKIDIPKSSVFNNHSGWRATNKVEDKKSKKPMISRPKDPKLGKDHDGQSKAKPEKDKSLFANLTKDTSAQDFGFSAIPKPGSRRVGLGGNAPSTQKSGETPHLSVSRETMIRRPGPSPSIKVKTTVVEPEQGSKAKPSSASDSSSLNVEKGTVPQEVTKDKVAGKATADIMEPRRSNRRIQPTSRLLEGLQTSPTVVKSSSTNLSLEKGGKAQSKTSFSRNAKD